MWGPCGRPHFRRPGGSSIYAGPPLRRPGGSAVHAGPLSPGLVGARSTRVPRSPGPVGAPSTRTPSLRGGLSPCGPALGVVRMQTYWQELCRRGPGEGPAC